jgi:hypothetical protein
MGGPLRTILRCESQLPPSTTLLVVRPLFSIVSSVCFRILCAPNQAKTTTTAKSKLDKQPTHSTVKMSIKWTIESWCESQIPSNWASLSASSQLFLQKLNLSSIHPFCDESSSYYFRPYEILGVPGQGPLLTYDHLDGFVDKIITFSIMAIPSVAAMIELWLRLFASIIAPTGITYLLYVTAIHKPSKLTATTPELNKSDTSPRMLLLLSIICTLTTASSVVILTDTLYVLEFGPKLGGILLLISLYLSIRTAYNHHLQKTIFAQILLFLLCCHLAIDLSTFTVNFGCPKEAVTKVSEGLYYDRKYFFKFSCLLLCCIYTVS